MKDQPPTDAEQFWINAQVARELDVQGREGKLPTVPRCKMIATESVSVPTCTENGVAPLPEFANRSRAIWGDKPNRQPLSETIIDDREERL